MHFSSSSYCLNKIKVYTVCILGCNILLLKGPTHEEAALPCREFYICQETMTRCTVIFFSLQSPTYLYNLICLHITIIAHCGYALTYKQVLCVGLRYFSRQINTNSSHLICSIYLDIKISRQIDIHALHMCVCGGGKLYFFSNNGLYSPVCSRY